MAKAKCTCNLWQFLLGLALFSAGFYGVVMGVLSQRAGDLWYLVLAWYFGGFLVAKVGWWMKHASCTGCKVHK